MKKITIKYVAEPGDPVWVKNYRRGNQWETGKVLNTTVEINSPDKTGKQYWVSYRVMLDRISNNDNHIFLHVSNDGIQFIK